MSVLLSALSGRGFHEDVEPKIDVVNAEALEWDLESVQSGLRQCGDSDEQQRLVLDYSASASALLHGADASRPAA
jgi:hypothetical protein